jgi:hypothetical protein
LRQGTRLVRRRGSSRVHPCRNYGFSATAR